MGTSAVPTPPPLSLPSLLRSPLDDWFTADYLSAHDLSSCTTASSSSSSSASLDPPQRRSFLHSNPLDGFHLSAHSALAPVGSPVISSNSNSKDKPESPFNPSSNSVSAMSNFSMAGTNSTESSVAQHFQAFPGGSTHLGSTILKPKAENTPPCVSPGAALSSPASAGAGATKVTKRRARVNKKAPIAVLSADTSNFRAMVQQLTGIPTSYASPHIWGSSGTPLLRPQPTRFAYNGGLPTIDTSASFLGRKQIFPLLQRAQQPLMDGILSGGAGKNAAEHTPPQGRGNMVNYDALSSSLTSFPGLWNAMSNGTPSGLHKKGNVKELSAANLVSECEQAFPRQSSNLFESVLMSDDDLHTKSFFNGVDSWLAFDGGVLPSHSPRVDLAKIAS